VEKTILSTFNRNLTVAGCLPKLQEMKRERKCFQQVIHRKIGASNYEKCLYLLNSNKEKGRQVERPTAL
jgi:hypothetical protein